MTLPVSHSLRARLLAFLLAAVCLAALAQAVVAYRTALAEADEIFDYHMEQMAMAVGTGFPLGVPERAGLPARPPANLEFVLQAWSADGARILQTEAHTPPPERALAGFSTVRAPGATYRVYSLHTRSGVVQVSQDLGARRAMARELALRTVAPELLMLPLLMLAVWWVVGASLAPVERVRAQLARRQADDLGEVVEAGLPDEVRPLVSELNLLLGRLRRAFDAQKNFVADAAHELRSPLAALKLQAQSLQRSAAPAPRTSSTSC